MSFLFAPKRRALLVSFLKVAAVLFFTLSMVIYPQTVFQAALRGLDTWWRIVFPALLPFFVVSELLMGLGIVHSLGVLLEPIMRPLFNVPGSGAFVVAVGYTSGAPIGASLTGQLRRQNLCTKTEAERLMAFTNNASPLFMFGAVAVGMFNNPELGILIAGAHYLANLCVGLAMRFYAFKSTDFSANQQPNSNILRHAIRELLKAQQMDGRPLGKLLGDAIKDSVQLLLTIGGFIIIFSVVIEILSIIQLIGSLSKLLSIFTVGLNLDHDMLYALSSGLIEMTIGAKITSEVNAPLYQQLIVISIILGWLGLSVHAQAYSMIADTDIDFKPYLIARVGHSLLALFWTSLFLKFNISLNVFAPQLLCKVSPWLSSFQLLTLSLWIILTFLVASLLLMTISSLRNFLHYTFFHKS